MQWVCEICAYVHEGEEPPEMCPVCGTPVGSFSEQFDDEKDILHDEEYGHPAEGDGYEEWN